MKNSKVIIFDDSLSALDTETDAAIRQALREKNDGSTKFIISHRIASLQDADKIIVLERGKITQRGNHKELLSEEGLYRRIWDIQNAM
jgi:ATP-binding cassette subfamily B protein